MAAVLALCVVSFIHFLFVQARGALPGSTSFGIFTGQRKGLYSMIEFSTASRKICTAVFFTTCRVRTEDGFLVRVYRREVEIHILDIGGRHLGEGKLLPKV